MQQHIAWTLRYLAGWRLADQHTARTNAAEGSATLRERRHDQEDADAYLHSARLTDVADEPGTRSDEHGADHAL
jgi:hypothetical protein